MRIVSLILLLFLGSPPIRAGLDQHGESWNTLQLNTAFGSKSRVMLDGSHRFVISPATFRQYLIRLAPETALGSSQKFWLGGGYTFSTQAEVGEAWNQRIEHRPHVQLVYQKNSETYLHRNRLRIESRWMKDRHSDDDLVPSTRIRLQHRSAFPRKKNTSQHIVVAEETMVQGEGLKNFGFNQQRIYLGFRFERNKTRAVEIAYMSIVRVPKNSDIDLTHTLWINFSF